MHDIIVVVDFGGQYTHLLANKVRQCGVHSIIVDSDVDPHAIENLKGIIFSGGPRSVAELTEEEIEGFKKFLNWPILGICYGHQLLAKMLGGQVEANKTREYGLAKVKLLTLSELFGNFPRVANVWMSHADHVSQLPPDGEILAKTDNLPIAAFSFENKYFGLQFHPEVSHTKNGINIIETFIDICGCVKSWNCNNLADDITAAIREKVKDDKVLLFLSGGVDSTVCLALCLKALKKEQLEIVHVDTGFMRKNESETIIGRIRLLYPEINIEIIDAKVDFFAALKDIIDPEQKREIIGNLFVSLIKEKMNKDNLLLCQGTVYPDLIESGGSKNSHKIKTHHNRVDVIKELIKVGKVIEPLSALYKDEVREVGTSLGIPKDLIERSPFPGPGLAIRMICNNSIEAPSTISTYQIKSFYVDALPIRSVGVQGDGRTYLQPAVMWSNQSKLDWDNIKECATVITNTDARINRVFLSLEQPKLHLANMTLTEENVKTLQDVDYMVQKLGWKPEIWQFPVFMLPLQTEDGKWCFVLRPIKSLNAMTAEPYCMPFDKLKSLIENLKSLPSVGHILYEVTNKPPSCIEAE